MYKNRGVGICTVNKILLRKNIDFWAIFTYFFLEFSWNMGNASGAENYRNVIYGSSSINVWRDIFEFRPLYSAMDPRTWPEWQKNHPKKFPKFEVAVKKIVSVGVSNSECTRHETPRKQHLWGTKKFQWWLPVAPAESTKLWPDVEPTAIDLESI